VHCQLGKQLFLLVFIAHQVKLFRKIECRFQEWMEWAVTGGAVAVGVIALQIIGRFQKPKE
jgi:hypothetical protein